MWAQPGAAACPAVGQEPGEHLSLAKGCRGRAGVQLSPAAPAWAGWAFHGAKGEQDGPAPPQLLLARGTSGDTEGCASPLTPSHLGTLSPQPVLVAQDALARPGGFQSVFQLQPKGLELLIRGGWGGTLSTPLLPSQSAPCAPHAAAPRLAQGHGVAWHGGVRRVLSPGRTFQLPWPCPEPPAVPRRGVQVPAWCPCPAPRVTPLLFTSNC